MLAGWPGSSDGIPIIELPAGMGLNVMPRELIKVSSESIKNPNFRMPPLRKVIGMHFYLGLNLQVFRRNH
jgi:hypothetical protein